MLAPTTRANLLTCVWSRLGLVQARVHKNEWLEEERVTPIEVCSLVKIIEPY